MLALRRMATRDFTGYFFQKQRPFSTYNDNNYQRLLQSSDREKIVKIAKTYLLSDEAATFSKNEKVSHYELLDLVNKIEKSVLFPITKICGRPQSKLPNSPEDDCSESQRLVVAVKSNLCYNTYNIINYFTSKDNT